MNKLILTLTAAVFAVLGLHAAGADPEPEPGFRVYETCHDYIAINDDSGERINIRKVSMHEELDLQLPYTTCVEEIVFTGPPSRKLVCPETQTSRADGDSTEQYRVQRPVTIRVGGAVDREISGVLVYRESDGMPSVRRPCPSGPRH
ncbi:MAG: hypothetical protein PVJ47_08750 [Thiohalocapsa sp.]|jgi:hypothetical protein